MLKIVKSEEQITFRNSNRVNRRLETEALFEKRWQQNPEQFNPHRNVETTARLQRSFDLIQKHLSLHNASVVDLGCGFAELSKHCAKQGAQVLAVDISDLALKRLTEVQTSKQWVPFTTLEDSSFDLVIASDLIAEIPAEDHRLFFSELARLVKKDGFILVSTPLDLTTEAPLEFFLRLVETELDIEYIFKSYHAIWNRLNKWFHPLVNNNVMLKLLEHITEFWYQENGVSHVILLAKRKPLVMKLPVSEQPIERKLRKTVWE